MRILGIDAALRQTGLCVLGNKTARFATARCSGAVEDLWDLAHATVAELTREGPIDLAVIERHPFANRPHRGSVTRARHLANTLGVASGIWFSACRAADIPAQLVDVAEWRRVILRGRGRASGKAAAKVRAEAFCDARKIDPPSNVDEAEALCVSLFGLLTLTRASQ